MSKPSFRHRLSRIELARRAAKPLPPRVIAFATELNANPGAVTDLAIRKAAPSAQIEVREATRNDSA